MITDWEVGHDAYQILAPKVVVVGPSVASARHDLVSVLSQILLLLHAPRLVGAADLVPTELALRRDTILAIVYSHSSSLSRGMLEMPPWYHLGPVPWVGLA